MIALVIAGCSVGFGGEGSDVKGGHGCDYDGPVPNVHGAEWEGSPLACFLDGNWSNVDEDPAPITPHLVTDDMSFTTGPGIDDPTSFNTAFLAGIAAWEDVTGGAAVALIHEDTDRYTRAGESASDNANGVRMADEMSPKDELGNQPLAQTFCTPKKGVTPDYLDEWYFIDCDIVFYAKYDDPDLGPDTYWNWSTTSTFDTFDYHLPTVVAHELGHVLGLDEWWDDAGALMYGSLPPETIVTATSDDVEAANFIYDH